MALGHRGKIALPVPSVLYDSGAGILIYLSTGVNDPQGTVFVSPALLTHSLPANVFLYGRPL